MPEMFWLGSQVLAQQLKVKVTFMEIGSHLNWTVGVWDLIWGNCWHLNQKAAIFLGAETYSNLGSDSLYFDYSYKQPLGPRALTPSKGREREM